MRWSRRATQKNGATNDVIIPDRNNALPKSYWTNHGMIIMIWTDRHV
jgi:hypothetical protein